MEALKPEKPMNHLKRALLYIAVFQTLLVAGGSACSESIIDEKPVSPGDRVYFYNMSGMGLDRITRENGACTTGDMLVIESDGHFGLIDSGHRFDDTIVDKDGSAYSVPNVDKDGNEWGLTSQIENKNGEDAAAFCCERLGISHFDFIIATHGHSDHIGGMPYFAEYASRSSRPLVDDHTAYIYKAYRHINTVEDDLGVVDDNGEDSQPWHNQAFVYNAVSAMARRGVKAVDISMGLSTSDRCSYHDYQSVLEAMRAAGLGNVRYDQGIQDDVFDDTLSFDFGAMRIHLYNLYSVDGALSENVNSIAAVIDVKGKTFFSAGDLDCEYQTEQRIARHIHDNHGTIDVMKANHHGYNGANSKELLDRLQPEYVLITRGPVEKNERWTGSMAWYYCSHMADFNRGIYEVGRSDRGIMVDFGGEDPQFYNMTCTEDRVFFDPDCSLLRNRFDYEDGWYVWADEVLSSSSRSFYYITDNQLVTGWIKEGDYWYYLDEETGRMATGWNKLIWNNEEYMFYFSTESTEAFPEGAMFTGNQTIDGKQFLFDSSGCLIGES